jgi:hypothetical protein
MKTPVKNLILANEKAPFVTTRSAQQWKRKTAAAIGKPDLATASDEDLEDAYDKHIQLVADMSLVDDPFSSDATGNLIKGGMPPGPAAVVGNEAGRRATINLLVNEAMARGMNYEDAFCALQNSRPELFKVAPGQLSNERTRDPKATKAENDRLNQVQVLVNEKMKQGIEYDNAFRSVQRDNPHLFHA